MRETGLEDGRHSSFHRYPSPYTVSTRSNVASTSSELSPHALDVTVDGPVADVGIVRVAILMELLAGL